MNKSRKRLVREGDYVAEVNIELIDEGGGWGPYVPLDDAYRLDDVRDALLTGDIDKASSMSQVYRLVPM